MSGILRRDWIARLPSTPTLIVTSGCGNWTEWRYTISRQKSGADKAYDTTGFVSACRAVQVTPHVAQNTKHSDGSAIDTRTTRHTGYEVSQRKRKRIDPCFVWAKVISEIR